MSSESAFEATFPSQVPNKERPFLPMSKEQGTPGRTVEKRSIPINPQTGFPYSEQSPMDGTAYVRLHPQDLETIKQFVQREVHNALHPALGTCDVMHFLTVEATDETGKRWRGVLYAVEEET